MVASFVTDELASLVRRFAVEVGDDVLHAMAPELVFEPQSLAVETLAAIGRLNNINLVARIAINALSDADPVDGFTLNRRIQNDNQTAYIRFVRLASAIRLAELISEQHFEARDVADKRRKEFQDAILSLESGVDIAVYRTLGELRAAVLGFVREVSSQLPEIVTVSPTDVTPALVLSYNLYGDISQTDAIAERNRLPRPGFVPDRPISVEL